MDLILPPDRPQLSLINADRARSAREKHAHTELTRAHAERIRATRAALAAPRLGRIT
jgi:hypothetical protein